MASALSEYSRVAGTVGEADGVSVLVAELDSVCVDELVTVAEPDAVGAGVGDAVSVADAVVDALTPCVSDCVDVAVCVGVPEAVPDGVAVAVGDGACTAMRIWPLLSEMYSVRPVAARVVDDSATPYTVPNSALLPRPSA